MILWKNCFGYENFNSFAVCWEAVIADLDVSFGVTLTLMKNCQSDPKGTTYPPFVNTGAIATSHSSLLRLSVCLQYTLVSHSLSILTVPSCIVCYTFIYGRSFPPHSLSATALRYSAPDPSYYIRTCTMYIVHKCCESLSRWLSHISILSKIVEKPGKTRNSLAG
jgi:hypothetical protein